MQIDQQTNSNKIKRLSPDWLFMLIIVAISFYYNYHQLLFEQPQSVHKWRQADCASIALNYYSSGMNFFAPETHNLTSDGGTSGKCATSEIPILYYSVATLYHIFGYHEFIYRLLNTLLFFLGLFYLFKLVQYILKDNYWAIVLTLLFFASPVLVYYGNNFLSNSSALSFSFIGWYFFIRYVKERKHKLFVISMMIFFLAGAFKVTALFSVFAISGLLGLELLGITKLSAGQKVFSRPYRHIVMIMSVLMVIGSWIAYAGYYNHKHDTTYFSTTIFPIWSLDKVGISQILYNIRVIWLDQYFHLSALIFLALCSIFILIFVRKGNKILNLSILFIFLEAVVYILLQFWTFKDHDYYVIDLYILPVLIVIASFVILKKLSFSVFSSIYLKIVFAVFLAINIYHTQQQLEFRYNGEPNSYTKGNDIYNITPYLREIGIAPTDTVISLPDEGHVSLYLMNQKGWTDYTDARFNKGVPIRYNQDSLGIQKSINNGASYLILRGLNQLYLKPYLQSFSTHLKGNYNDVYIFDLKNSSRNFDLPELKQINYIYCDAEKRNDNGELFISNNDDLTFQNGNTQSNEYVFSGLYSSKLNHDKPYGFTFKIDSIYLGQKVTITVWKKATGTATGYLVASDTDASVFYNNKSQIIEKKNDGWEKLKQEFFITDALPNNELLIYTHNPEADAVYFDEIEILIHQSVLK